MTETAALSIQLAMKLVAGGKAQLLEGRSVNSCYRISHEGRDFSVKVHTPAESSQICLRRILRADQLLRGASWYPAVVDSGRVGERYPQLVVIRAFRAGAACDFRCAGDLWPLVGVLEDLASHGVSCEIAEELLGDYASPWLSGRAGRAAQAAGRLGAVAAKLTDELSSEAAGLMLAATRLTRPDEVRVYHGDLHGRNLISDPGGRLTVIDWDEAGFTARPSDAAKALWFACRRGRGDFALDPDALRRFFALAISRLGIPVTDLPDLARLGAIWFLPRTEHAVQLKMRDPGLATWYLQWITRFWRRYPGNLLLLEAAATSFSGDMPMHS